MQFRNNDWNNLSLLLTYSGFIYLEWRSGKNTWLDSPICRENNKVKKYDKIIYNVRLQPRASSFSSD